MERSGIRTRNVIIIVLLTIVVFSIGIGVGSANTLHTCVGAGLQLLKLQGVNVSIDAQTILNGLWMYKQQVNTYLNFSLDYPIPK